MNKLTELFASNVFSDKVMRERLPKDVYQALKKTIATGKQLEINVANTVATAMKEWAMEKGVTHFTHWFQPMTGVTAEKHDSFISPTGEGSVNMEFSGNELVRGEPDASSFPSGGLRATFEARGYTAWDPTSYAFIKNNTLCIPTAFSSYSGEALDKKTPLLRSMQAVDQQALRILKLFGDNQSSRVVSQIGPEQEYFLIDKKLYSRRPDLKNCGRTLFGARPSKGQELEDHYFGSIKERVASFMSELNTELWKLGIYAKTEHNEVAPAQHELAPVYANANIAADHNQLTMEMMKKIANRHGMTCLLHEKPFAGVNGSGKHVNWSLTTDTGINLLSPGDTPSENAQFLLFLAAVLKAVDENQDLLRISVASAGNDHRLGANEAPPAIISVFLGEELSNVLNALESGTAYQGKKRIEHEIGVSALPRFPKDLTDRNRTSPFAFTGNKFEFRMVGSAFSISGPIIVLNTIVAESLSQFADELEASKNFNLDMKKLIVSTIKKHKKIVFNGNNYSDEWVEEAKSRGLLNLKDTVSAIKHFISPKNVELFCKHKVFAKNEIYSRYEILLENYAKTLNIEALTLIDMVKKDILPACFSYMQALLNVNASKQAAGIKTTDDAETSLIELISALTSSAYRKLNLLEQTVTNSKHSDACEHAEYFKDKVIPAMNELRAVIDQLEQNVSKSVWPYPDYMDLLYSVD